MVFLQISRFLDSNSQLRIHKMMTDCLHYKDYARDAIKLVVQKLEGGVVDGKRGGEGPSVEMWPGAPSNLKTALRSVSFECVYMKPEVYPKLIGLVLKVKWGHASKKWERIQRPNKYRRGSKVKSC